MEILFYWKILKVDSRHEIWISSNNFSVPYKFYVLFFDFYCYLSLIKLTLNNKSFYLFPQNFRQERTTRVCCLVNHVIQEILCMLLFVIVAHIDRVLCDHDIIPGTWDSWHCTVTLSRCQGPVSCDKLISSIAWPQRLTNCSSGFKGKLVD